MPDKSLDQLSVQIYSTNTEVVAVLASQNDSTVDLSLRTVNVPKTKDGLGFSIKVCLFLNLCLTTKQIGWNR